MLKKFLLAVGFVFATVGFSFAADKGTADEAKAMVAKAQQEIKAKGLEAASKAFTEDAKWKDKDLYVFVIKFDGLTLGHGGSKSQVGKNVAALKDANGKEFVKEFIETAKGKGSGWVDYYWLNGVSKKVEPKSAYVEVVPGQEAFVSVGIYK